MLRSPLRHAHHAFTLIEMAVVLLIIGLMATLILRTDSSSTAVNCYTQTQAQLSGINVAIETFVRNNNRYPTPAGRSFNANNPQSGREASGADIDTIPNGGSPILTGALPFQALGLSDSFGADCWGNKLSYFVTESLTRSDATGFPNVTSNGVISVRNGPIGASAPIILPDAAYAVVSHGEDGVGAVAKNYSGASHGWCSSVGTHIDTENCDGTSAGNNRIYTAPFNNGANAGVNYYDDLIIFSGKINSNCNQASYPVSWSVGMESCSAVVTGPRAHATSIPVSSSLPVGSAVMRCVNGAMIQDTSEPSSCGVEESCGTGPGGWGSCGITSCPTQVISWAGGNCEAEFDGLSNGFVSPVTPNTNAGYSGSAQVRCQSGLWVMEPGETCNIDP